MAFGSAAVRSPRPSAGLLSDGDPIPPAARDFSAAVNKEWDERSNTGPAPRAGNDVDATALSRRENQPDALVVIHGPGGFPLVGAVAIGHRHRNPATEVGDFAAPHAIGDVDPELAAGPASHDFVASVSMPLGEPADTHFLETLDDARDLEEFPVSVFSGLGLATMFTLNAVLSQPIAGFDYLPLPASTQMDAPRQIGITGARRRATTKP